MGQTVAEGDHLLQTRGVGRTLDGFVVAVAFDRAGKAAAFALGDGSVHVAALNQPDWTRIEVHEGAVLALAADAAPSGWISGGDDGRFQRIGGDLAVELIAPFGTKWVEQVASFTDGKVRLLACGVGKTVHLFDAKGDVLKSLAHPSTVTGLVFDAKGKRIAVSHYNGASIWFVASRSDNARRLEWKGSHIGIAISPDGDCVVTAMQENALHGWRLSDGQHMRMSGYPAKTKALSFTRNGKFLASSGADSIVLWPFFGGGPMGRAPTELARRDGMICTQVACHPVREMVAAGFNDGMVVLAEGGSSRVLPVAAEGHGAISALAWSPDGAMLAFGTETGFAALVDLSER
jgi:WD40 repeat protein